MADGAAEGAAAAAAAADNALAYYALLLPVAGSAAIARGEATVDASHRPWRSYVDAQTAGAAVLSLRREQLATRLRQLLDKIVHDVSEPGAPNDDEARRGAAGVAGAADNAAAMMQRFEQLMLIPFPDSDDRDAAANGANKEPAAASTAPPERSEAVVVEALGAVGAATS